MKYLKILLLFISPLFATAQPLGTWPVQYGDTPPTHTPSGSGTRIYLNISTSELYNWNPAPVSSWVKYPKGFDQISGCSSPGYTPTARQSVFAVNSCTALQNGRGPELYQYTGTQWVCLNCYPAYTAGTGIGISSGVITNTAPDQVVSISGVGITTSGTYPNFTLTATDQSATNELQNLSLSGQSLGISSGTGVTLPVVGVTAGTGIGVSSSSGNFIVSNAAPDQTVSITNGGGISVSGTYPFFTLTATDQSTTNELNTSFSVSGSNLALTDAGGTINVPVSSIAPVQAVAAGSGISISGTTTRTVTAADVSPTNELQTLSLSGSDLTLSDGGGTVTLPGGGNIYTENGTITGDRVVTGNDKSLEINNLSSYILQSSYMNMQADEGYFSGGYFGFNSDYIESNCISSTYAVSDGLGIRYPAEYPDIIENDRSIPDVGIMKDWVANHGGSLGTGFTYGGGGGTIPDGTTATLSTGGSFGTREVRMLFGIPSFIQSQGDNYPEFGFEDYDPDNEIAAFFGYSSEAAGQFSFGAFDLGSGASSGLLANPYSVSIGSSTIDFTINSNSGTGAKITDARTTKKGIEYGGNYSATIKTNDRSIPDVGTVNIIKQDLVSYTTTQRNAISSPLAGRTIYCSDCTATDSSTGVTQTYNGSTWKNHW